MLRPRRMQEMVGQRAVYERIKIAVDAAADGPPRSRSGTFCSTAHRGSGKTTFATCIPRDLGVPLCRSQVARRSPRRRTCCLT